MEGQKPSPKTALIPKESHKPDVDAERIAEELKAFVNERKLDHVDYEYFEIEMYPDPRSEKLSFAGLRRIFRRLFRRRMGLLEFAKFCSQWEALFDYADKITQDDGTGFPAEDVKLFEDKLAEIQVVMNRDEAFWKMIQEEVLPIYVHSKDYEKVWKNRWRAVKLFYDPVGITVTTHKKMVNRLTGEVTERKLISKRDIPAGIVVKIQ